MFDSLDYQLSIPDHDFSASSSSSSPRRRGGSVVASPARPLLVHSPAEECEHCSCGEQGHCTDTDVSYSIPDEQQIKLLNSRVVLSFQYKLGEVMVARWLEEYNARTGRKLRWSQPLPNYLHMVDIEDEDPEYAVEQLITESPLESLGIFAAVNRYNPTFLSEKPKSLRQIVTVLISNQSLFNQLVFNLADLILAPVGKVVGKQFRKNKKGTRIEAVVETCRDSFVTEIEVPLLDTQTLLLELDYVGLTSGDQSRSLFGKAKDCLNSLKPKKGLKPPPPCGNLSCFRRERACLSIDC